MLFPGVVAIKNIPAPLKSGDVHLVKALGYRRGVVQSLGPLPPGRTFDMKEGDTVIYERFRKQYDDLDFVLLEEVIAVCNNKILPGG